MTDTVDPRVVAAEFAWWFPEMKAPDYGFRECSINFLTDDKNVGPESGSTNLKGLMCQVSKADEAPAAYAQRNPALGIA